ncbi:hypothetical protein ACWDA3_53455 [Nonomuraea rubra]
MSEDENRSAANLLLLCEAHASEIDATPELFPPELLRQWKRDQVLAHDKAVTGTPLTNDEVAEVFTASFNIDEAVGAITSLLPFTPKSRSRREALDLATRQSLGRRKTRLRLIPSHRHQAVLEWMEKHRGQDVIVSKGELRVLVGPMGAGKSELASRWWNEGLKVASVNDSIEIPIWLNARNALPDLASAVTRALGGDPERPCRVVLDELDSVSLRDADWLLDTARQLVTVWPNMRILATCRPGVFVIPEECIPVLPWSMEDGSELLQVVLANKVPNEIWTSETRDALRSPLLVHAMAARLMSGKESRVSRLALLSELPHIIMQREHPEASDITWEQLALLARHILDSHGPISAFPLTEPQIQALMNTGLIVNDADGLRFALPIFEQYFGAQALKLGIVELERAGDAESFPSWRYAIAFVLSTLDIGEFHPWMLRLAGTNPAAASWIIDEISPTDAEPARGPSAAVVQWTASRPHGEPIDPLRAGRWLRDAVQAFLGGFGVCRTELARHNEGRLVQWGVQTRNGDMKLHIAREEVVPELVIPESQFSPMSVLPEWAEWSLFTLPHNDLEGWRWARSQLRNPLQRLLKECRLPLPAESPLNKERMWVLAERIMEITGQAWSPSLALDELRAAVANLMDGVEGAAHSTWQGRKGKVDSADIRWIHSHLRMLDGDSVEYPRPLPDRVHLAQNWWWHAYSPELSRTILAEVLHDAIIGYRDLVRANFSRFGFSLGLYSMLPVRVEGLLMRPEGDPYDDGAGLYYRIIPEGNIGTRDTSPQIDLRLAATPRQFPDRFHHSSNFSRRSAFRRYHEVLTDLPASDQMATDLAYDWLSEDLGAVGWSNQSF